MTRPVDSPEPYCDQLSDDLSLKPRQLGGHFHCLLGETPPMYYTEACYSRHTAMCPRHQAMREAQMKEITDQFIDLSNEGGS